MYESLLTFFATLFNVGPDEIVLWALFLSAFISSTLFPGGSELVVGALAAQDGSDKWTLLAVASVGNTLGALTSYGLGRLIALRYGVQTLHKPSQQRAIAHVQRWGAPVLLLSWLPIVGDPLCVAAGWMRMPLVLAATLIAIGKTARYAAIIWLV